MHGDKSSLTRYYQLILAKVLSIPAEIPSEDFTSIGNTMKCVIKQRNKDILGHREESIQCQGSLFIDQILCILVLNVLGEQCKNEPGGVSTLYFQMR